MRVPQKSSLSWSIFVGDDPLVSNPYQNNVPFISFDTWIIDVEILERRNSRNKKCSEDNRPHDEVIIERHLAEHECGPPNLTLCVILQKKYTPQSCFTQRQSL